MADQKIHPITMLLSTAQFAPVPFERHVLCRQSAELLSQRLEELATAEAEVKRLQALCEEHEIEHDAPPASVHTLGDVPSEQEGG